MSTMRAICTRRAASLDQADPHRGPQRREDPPLPLRAGRLACRSVAGHCLKLRERGVLEPATNVSRVPAGRGSGRAAEQGAADHSEGQPCRRPATGASRVSPRGLAGRFALRRRAGRWRRVEQLVGRALLLVRQGGVKRFERRHQPLQIVGFGLSEARRGAQTLDRVCWTLCCAFCITASIACGVLLDDFANWSNLRLLRGGNVELLLDIGELRLDRIVRPALFCAAPGFCPVGDGPVPVAGRFTVCAVALSAATPSDSSSMAPASARTRGLGRGLSRRSSAYGMDRILFACGGGRWTSMPASPNARVNHAREPVNDRPAALCRAYFPVLRPPRRPPCSRRPDCRRDWRTATIPAMIAASATYRRRTGIGRPRGMKIDLSGKRAVVTGGSRGIGRAIALGAAEAGASVSVCARGADGLAPVRDAIAAHGRHGARAGLRRRRPAGAVRLYRRGGRGARRHRHPGRATPRALAPPTTRPAGRAASMSICWVRRARSGRPCRHIEKAAAARSSIFPRSRGSALRRARCPTAR